MILTKTVLPVELFIFSVPSVNVLLSFDTVEPVVILSPDVKAQPLLPLPPLPVSLPGTPEPA